MSGTRRVPLVPVSPKYGGSTHLTGPGYAQVLVSGVIKVLMSVVSVVGRHLPI